MSKIVFIAPSKGMAQLGYEILPELSQEMNIEAIDIKVGFMDYAVEVARSLDEEMVDVIVTRGGTASLIKNSDIEIPVVEVSITGKELVDAINKATEISKKPDPVIGYIGFENMVRNIRMFSGILNINLKIYLVQSTKDIEMKVLQAKADGMDVIIGGVLTGQYANQNQLLSVDIGATKESLIAAFKIAEEIRYARTLDHKKAEELKTILDSAFEVIIGTDDQGIITVFNAAAELFLKTNAAQAIGSNLKTTIPIIDDHDLHTVFVEGKQILAKIVKTNQASVVLNFSPIIVGGKIMATILSLQEIDRIQNVEAKIREELYLKGNIAEYNFEHIIGESTAIKETKRIAESFAKLDSIVLILGETGTGKELFAQSIHNASLRSQGPFVAVNCGAIPSNLIESELFGYSEGAFTGAKKGGKRGLFEIAHRGTIFLDEISEMDIYGQVMLLRVIQEKQIRRIGDDRVIPIDVRIIAATNKSLIQLVEEKKFREDLYYRLNVLTLNIPPLRNRLNDIEYLMSYFIEDYNKKFYKYVTLTKAAIAEIRNYPWYGNVRHLKSFCERLVALANQNELDVAIIKRQLENELLPSHYSQELIPSPVTETPVPNEIYYNPSKTDYSVQIVELLQHYQGNRSKVAEHLGISRTTLWRQMKQYHIISNYEKTVIKGE